MLLVLSWMCSRRRKSHYLSDRGTGELLINPHGAEPPAPTHRIYITAELTGLPDPFWESDSSPCCCWEAGGLHRTRQRHWGSVGLLVHPGHTNPPNKNVCSWQSFRAGSQTYLPTHKQLNVSRQRRALARCLPFWADPAERHFHARVHFSLLLFNQWNDFHAAPRVLSTQQGKAVWLDQLLCLKSVCWCRHVPVFLFALFSPCYIAAYKIAHGNGEVP